MKTFTLLLSLIGASAWLSPWVKEWFQKPEVHARIVMKNSGLGFTRDWYDIRGDRHIDSGAGYSLSLVMTCLQRTLDVRSCSVYVRYPGDSRRYSGFLYSMQGSNIVFDGERRYWHVPFEQELCQTIVLEKGKTYRRYAAIIVPGVPRGTNLNLADFEFVFRDYRSFRLSVAVPANMIDPRTMEWDSMLMSDRP